MTDAPSAPARTARPALLLSGLAAVALGLAALVWPERSLLVIGVLFGVFLILTGALRLVTALRTPLPGVLRGFVAVLGALVLAAGVLTLVNPFDGLEVLAYVIGIAWIADGVAGLFGGMPDADLVPRGLAVASCAVSILGGIAILLLPGIAIAGFLLLGAILLLLSGVLLVLVWVLMRRRARA
ncbi:DUF308 domain-containing protein [Microcella daejeonensis]|jgi:uncharacterized membrane protein HdeD (DUF308 family)|uniref:DUF308 domain-containing protein n=1 Tax=Microcella daejeonensis TaxID=2994971 RepID=UPI00226D6C49|nr:DUF308 domain-containing protein [Microcella daejeonensis]WAB83713.1 DUF308 domain-containing protein [Microcella daejeonensis]